MAKVKYELDGAMGELDLEPEKIARRVADEYHDAAFPDAVHGYTQQVARSVAAQVVQRLRRTGWVEGG